MTSEFSVGELVDEQMAEGEVGPEGKYVKRRKYKRRRASGNHGGNGFFRRVFGK